MLSRVVAVSIVLASGAAHADRVVALAPLSTLGAEDTSASTKQLTAQIEAALAAMPGTKVVPAARVAEAIKKARRPQLKACEGDTSCLVEIGKLVGAQVVIDGEVGGLGEAKVVYLGATDVATARELRSTTLSVGTKEDGGGPNGAAARLLDPDKYRGALRLMVDVTGATIYVNGTRTTLSPRGEITLPVGTQAVRVTHPEYRDFVRFLDVGYGKTTEVAVGMQQYPIIQHDITGHATSSDRIEYLDPPLWRRWYVVTPVAVGLTILTAIIVGKVANQFPEGPCRRVGGGPC